MTTLVINIIIICLYPFVLSQLNVRGKVQRKVFLFLAFAHLLSLYILKDPRPFPDIEEYYIYFENLSPDFRNMTNERYMDRVELGWYIYNKVLQKIFHNPFSMICITAILTLLAYLSVFSRNSKVLWLSVFLFFCTNFYPSLFVLRQHLAIPICLLTIPYVIKRDFKKFAILTAIAVSFHYSALMWIVAYFIYSTNLNIRNSLVGIVLFLVLVLSLDFVLSQLGNVLPIIMSYNADAFDGDASRGGAFKPFLVDLSVILFSLLAFHGINNIRGVNRFCLMMTALAMLFDVFHIIGSSFAEFSRLNLYYQSCAIILLPNAVYEFKGSLLKVVIVVGICFLYFWQFSAFVNYGFKFI